MGTTTTTLTPYDPDEIGPGGGSHTDAKPATAYDPDADKQPPSIMNGSDARDAFLHRVGVGTRDVINVVAKPVGALTDLVTWPARAAIRASGGTATAPSDLIQRGLTAAGLPEAKTEGEKLTSTVVEGAGSTLPTLGLGAIPAVARAIPALAVNPTVANAVRMLIQGGVGAVAGEEAASSPYVPDYLKPTARLVANIAGGTVADVGTNVATKAVNAVSGNMQPVYAAAERLNMNPRLVGTFSGSEGGRAVEAAGTRMPFVSSVLRPVQQQTIDRFGNVAENTAARLNPAATTEQNTGEIIQQQARDWKDNVFPAAEASVWNPVNRNMAFQRVDPTNYQQALDDVTSALSRSEASLTPARITELRALLAQDLPNPGQAFAWEQAQALRSKLGKVLGVPEIVQSIGQDNLTRLYGGLSRDMRAAAAANGQADAFDMANGVSTAGHAFIEGTLSKIIRSNNPAQETITPELATKALLNGGDTALEQLRAHMPDAADALAAFKLRQMAQAKPSQAIDYGDTSTGTFLSNYNRTRQQQPGGFTALYNTPQTQQTLADLATVAGALRQTERHLNTSGTAEALGWQKYVNDILSAKTATERAQAAVLPVVAGKTVGKLLTNPDIARYVAAVGAGPSPLSRSVTGAISATPGLLGSPPVQFQPF